MGRKFHPLRRIKHLEWYEHFLGVLIKYGFEELASDISGYLGKATPRVLERIAEKHSRPVRVRMALEELGPTFIKLGQLLSTRADLIPREYVDELRHLQDQAPHVEFERLRPQLETNLGGKVEEIFKTFDQTPLAAGSIAQVHLAVTRNGESVVVKARRPGIEETIRTECEIFLTLVDAAKGILEQEGIPDPHRIMEEFTRAVEKEVDLSHEKRNQIRFWHKFADDPRFHIPKVYEDLCSEAVLTMEFIDGLKLGTKQNIAQSGFDPEVIAERSIDFILQQIFESHLFHTDPHPGNWFLMPGNVICLIDFGQTANITFKTRELLMEWIKAIIERDIPGMIRTFQHEEVLSEKTDINKLSFDIEEIFDLYLNVPLEEIAFHDVMIENMELIRKHHITPPEGFALILKSLLIVDSIGSSLNTSYNIIPALRRYIQRFYDLQVRPQRFRRLKYGALDAGDLLINMPNHLTTIFKKLRGGQFDFPLKIHRLGDLIHILNMSAKYISGAIIVGSLLLTSTLLLRTEAFLFGAINVRHIGLLGFIIALVLGFWIFIMMIQRP
jgi:ubiquinone biosynthesis protein